MSGQIKAGDLVECIDAKPWPEDFPLAPGDALLVEGGLYTVTEIDIAWSVFDEPVLCCNVKEAPIADDEGMRDIRRFRLISRPSKLLIESLRALPVDRERVPA